LLNDKRDVKAMFSGMKTARKLLHGLPLDVLSPVNTSPKHFLDKDKPDRRAADPFLTPAKINCFEILPGPLFGDTEKEDNFQIYAQNFAATYYHACGTCAMESSKTEGRNSNENISGEDEACKISEDNDDSHSTPSNVYGSDNSTNSMAVVDSELRVRGVLNLRVADASVFPAIPSGPTSATCMAVGEVNYHLLHL
jgi:choline dehydrogenase-like flavoprotein